MFVQLKEPNETAFEITSLMAKRKRNDEENYLNLTSLKARLPYVSQAALGSFLSIAEREVLPKGNRNTVRKARDNHVNTLTPYGTIHQDIQVGDMQVEVQYPFAMLHHVCQKSQAFSSLMARTIAAHPCSPASPWKLILYCDGVAPGNPFNYAKARKTWAWYWSFYEFNEALSNEDTWFELAVTRQSIINKLLGGLSAMFRCLLQTLFDPGSHDFSKSGAQLTLYDGTQVFIFCELEIIVSDEDAIHQMYACMGASGLKMCLLCFNVFNARQV